MALDQFALSGSAWLGLLAWAASEWLKNTSSAAGVREERARLLFSAGALALLVHSALAFALRYGWSHAAAAQETARQTEAVTGLAFRGGLIVNELFLALWLVEALWWWRSPTRYRARGRALEWAVRAFFFVMFLNGAVVFARGTVRLVGAAALVAVAWAWYRRPGRGGKVAHG
jgi:hypothetical protein